MNVDVKKDFYNTLTSKDGKHYELENEKTKIFYHLKIESDYGDIENRNQLISLIQEDLKELIIDLENMKEKDKNQNWR